MKSYHKNPRKITEKQLSDLEKWLRELGDLSGIVHDLNSDEIVAGNQRGRVFDVNQCEVVLTKELAEPDEQGTVALGYVVWEGKQYNYRQVRWTPRQCEQANIVANKAGGEWDFDIMASEFEVTDLLDWGFKRYELGIPSENVDYNELWKGMPEFENMPRAIQTIHVHFENPEAINEFSELIKQPITERTRSIWYPEKQREDLRDLRYES